MFRKLFKRVRKKWQVLKRRRKQRRVICPWCGMEIKPRSQITAYSLYNEEDLKNFLVAGVKILPKKCHEKAILIGCARPSCPANKQGVVIAGVLNGFGKPELCPYEKRYLAFF